MELERGGISNDNKTECSPSRSGIIPSSENQGQLVGEKRNVPGRNRSGESFQEERKELLGNESLQTISKRLCECWLLIEQKKILCIILTNRRTVTSESLSCVPTRRLFYRP